MATTQDLQSKRLNRRGFLAGAALGATERHALCTNEG